MNVDCILKTWRRVAFLWIVSCILIIPLAPSHFVRSIENHILDWFYALRGSLAQPPDLLLVGIDEASFQELRLPWPWPRALHGELIEKLTAAGARLILFDILFTEASDPRNDQIFADAMKKAGNVLLAETLDYTNDPLFSRVIHLRPCELFVRSALGTGLAMITPDSDGIVRRFETVLEGTRTLAAVGAGQSETVRQSGLIRFAGPARSIDTLSYYQIIDDQSAVPENLIRGRIVLVGRTLQATPTRMGQADFFPTPFYPSTGVLTSGVEIHANVIHNLVSGRWGHEVPLHVLILAYFPLFFVAALVFGKLSPLGGLGGLALALPGLAGASYVLFSVLDLWAPPLIAASGATFIYAANVLLQYIQEAKNKRWYHNAFGRYVSPDVVKAIIASPEGLELGGQEVEATLFFSDLAEFTRFSERLRPKDLVQFLNEYFTPMTRIIMAHKGGLDKFIGDAIMAFWGVPLPLEEHARLACRAALRMRESISELQAGWRERNLPMLSARMGLHSGPVVAGNVGSSERFNYTVMGDTVNLASRLESANKIYGTTIIVSEDTKCLAGDEFVFRELDLIKAKGREAPVRIYELVGRTGGSDLPFLRTFEDGLNAYRNRRWEEAERLFESIAHMDPPSNAYLQRCRVNKTQPPSEDWDGTFVQSVK
ncbi:MAG: adenylate/guanylate cyclase domain-containing protein [Desulfobacteraceae bacterium]|nr:adenylate/guanylate cyclase domain-containing protein [Desulfobacteraceae bacterium]